MINDLYLVVNIQDEEEKVILDICSDEETANNLKEKYINNFKENNYENAEEIIEINHIPLNLYDDETIIWSYDKNN